MVSEEWELVSNGQWPGKGRVCRGEKEWLRVTPVIQPPAVCLHPCGWALPQPRSQLPLTVPKFDHPKGSQHRVLSFQILPPHHVQLHLAELPFIAAKVVAGHGG